MCFMNTYKNKLDCRVTLYHIKLAPEWVLDQASIPRHLISTGTRFAVPVGQVPYLDKLGMNQVIFLEFFKIWIFINNPNFVLQF